MPASPPPLASFLAGGAPPARGPSPAQMSALQVLKEQQQQQQHLTLAHINRTVAYTGGGRFAGSVEWSPAERLEVGDVGTVVAHDPAAPNGWVLTVQFPRCIVRVTPHDVVHVDGLGAVGPGVHDGTPAVPSPPVEPPAPPTRTPFAPDAAALATASTLTRPAYPLASPPAIGGGRRPPETALPPSLSGPLSEALAVAGTGDLGSPLAPTHAAAGPEGDANRGAAAEGDGEHAVAYPSRSSAARTDGRRERERSASPDLRDADHVNRIRRDARGVMQRFERVTAGAVAERSPSPRPRREAGATEGSTATTSPTAPTPAGGSPTAKPWGGGYIQAIEALQSQVEEITRTAGASGFSGLSSVAAAAAAAVAPTPAAASPTSPTARDGGGGGGQGDAAVVPAGPERIGLGHAGDAVLLTLPPQRLLDEIRLLQAELADVKERRADATATRDEALAKLDERDAAIQTLEGQVAQQRGVMEKAEVLLAERRAHARELQQLEDDLEAAHAEADRLREENAAQAKRVRDLRARSDHATSQLHAQDEEIRGEREKKVALAEQLAGLRGLRREVGALEDAVKRAERERDAAARQVETLTSSRDELSRTARRDALRFKEEIQRQREHRLELEARIEELEGALHAARTEAAEDRQRAAQRSTQLLHLEAEVAKYQQGVFDLRQQTFDLKHKLTATAVNQSLQLAVSERGQSPVRGVVGTTVDGDGGRLSLSPSPSPAPRPQGGLVPHAREIGGAPANTTAFTPRKPLPASHLQVGAKVRTAGATATLVEPYVGSDPGIHGGCWWVRLPGGDERLAAPHEMSAA